MNDKLDEILKRLDDIEYRIFQLEKLNPIEAHWTDRCDSCGCKPTIIYKTEMGIMCKKCFESMNKNTVT